MKSIIDLFPKDLHNEDQIHCPPILGQFTSEVQELIESILQEGFVLTLVGGAVRDFFLNGKFPNDLDFELRHPYEYDEKTWSQRLVRLGSRLENDYQQNVEYLSFSIMRISWKNSSVEVELAPARIESYKNDERDEGEKAQRAQALGHSDMSVKLVSQCPYEQSFARRDFTINALGLEFSKTNDEISLRFIDPFQGYQDLKNMKLHHCSDDFSKDPVRFCRALRFSCKYNFSLSQELLNEQIKNFNLTKLTNFYFFREAFKGPFFIFCHHFFQTVNRYAIPLSESIRKLDFLMGTLEDNSVLCYKEKVENELEVLCALIYDPLWKVELSQLDHFCKMAKLKSGTLDGHLNLKATLEELRGFNAQKIGEEMGSLQFSEFEVHPLKSALKRFHMIHSKNCGDDFDQLLKRFNSDLGDIYRKFAEILPCDLKGRALFQKMLSDDSLAPAQRSDALYFCHFVEAKNS
ncbi:MAG: hypothetical protein CME60_02700 [Halobacteriovoraceae bacterium]|nr:hypothetical protein [Halobacteriovoraceae bacterium]